MKLAATLSLLLSLISLPLWADPIWIDVRSAEEYQQGHLPGAIHIPHTDIASRIHEVTQDKNAQIQLYCRSGRRSGLAEAELKKLGFSKVVNAGSFDTLQKQQQPHN